MCLFLFFIFLSGVLSAQTQPVTTGASTNASTTPSTPGAEKTSRIYSFREATMDEIEAVVRTVASPDAKIIPMPKTSKIYVQDIPGKLDEIGAAIAQVDVPRPDVRIDLTFDEATQDRSNHGGLQVGMEAGTVVISGGQPVPHRENNALIRPNGNTTVIIGGNNRQTTSDVHQTQFLVTRSGSPAYVRMGEDVPRVDYFYKYAVNAGLVLIPDPAHPGRVMVISPATAAQIHWESVGTRMSVTPTVIDNRIRVDIMPEISVVSEQTGEGSKWGRRVNQVISFRGLATTVTVESGKPVYIGGFSGAGDDFNHHFFSDGKSSGVQSTSFTLKATILEPGQMY